jgi:hypothetical protein
LSPRNKAFKYIYFVGFTIRLGRQEFHRGTELVSAIEIV